TTQRHAIGRATRDCASFERDAAWQCKQQCKHGVRAMTIRMLATSALAFVAAGSALVPVETAARAGGMIGMRPMAVRAPMRMPVVRPPIVRHPVHVSPPVVPRGLPPGAAPQGGAFHTARRPVAPFNPPTRRHAGFRSGLPVTVFGGGAFYGSY